MRVKSIAVCVPCASCSHTFSMPVPWKLRFWPMFVIIHTVCSKNIMLISYLWWKLGSPSSKAFSCMFHVPIMAKKEEMCQIMYGSILHDLTECQRFPSTRSSIGKNMHMESRPSVAKVGSKTKNAPQVAPNHNFFFSPCQLLSYENRQTAPLQTYMPNMILCNQIWQEVCFVL